MQSRTGASRESRHEHLAPGAILQWATRPISQVSESQREAWQTAFDPAVERLLVLLGDVLLERRRVRVADLGERIDGLLDEVQVRGVALLGVLAAGTVVRTLGLVAGGDQLCIVLGEEAELTLDQVGEPAHALVQ